MIPSMEYPRNHKGRLSLLETVIGDVAGLYDQAIKGKTTKKKQEDRFTLRLSISYLQELLAIRIREYNRENGRTRIVERRGNIYPFPLPLDKREKRMIGV
jgi:hypothetical protein